MGQKYSGQEAKAEVIYLLDDRFIGIQPGYVVMGIELVTEDIEERNL